MNAKTSHLKNNRIDEKCIYTFISLFLGIEVVITLSMENSLPLQPNTHLVY